MESRVELDDLIRRRGEWLRGEGPEADIVISSRIRLARNLAEYPFMSRTSDADRERIEASVRECLFDNPGFGPLLYVGVDALADLDRQFLVERHLISRELAEGRSSRAVAIAEDETYSVMVNEEDHLRLQAMQSGLNLGETWQRINRIDDLLEERLTYAFGPKLGYLTACPTNVGTGMRVSVMLHLPALVLTRHIEKVFRSLQKIGLAVRGLFGEGSQALGDFYQISNQVTLGNSEEGLLKQVGDIVPNIISYERQARDILVRESRDTLHDRVSRAYGVLRTAQTISSEETLLLLSAVRMGIHLGLLEGLTVATVNELFLQTQPAHLQKIAGSDLDRGDRNIERARFLREHLK